MSIRAQSTIRAAAILTTAEVKTAALSVVPADGGRFVLRLQLTLGSLTNASFNFYSTDDGTTWTPHELSDGTVTRQFTATTDRDLVIEAPGKQAIAVGVIGVGTTTSSSATVTAYWLKRGTQR